MTAKPKPKRPSRPFLMIPAPPKFKALIKQAADADDRPMSVWARRILERAATKIEVEESGEGYRRLQKDYRNLRATVGELVGPRWAGGKSFWEASDLDLQHGIYNRIERLERSRSVLRDALVKCRAALEAHAPHRSLCTDIDAALNFSDPAKGGTPAAPTKEALKPVT